MFPGEDDHRVIEEEHIIQAAFFCAFALVVNDSRFGEIVVFIAGFSDTVTQVNVFAVHEETFIQQPCFIQRFASDKHESSGKHIHGMDFLAVQKPEMISTENL